MGNFLQLSRGEIRVNGHENPYILANTLEAFLGAIHLNFGFEITKKFIIEHIYSTLNDIIDRGLYVDPKSFLQEMSQSIWGILPEYRLLGAEGQDHNKIYTIAAYLGDFLIGEGKGTSKKKGEQEAAENAILRRNEWEKLIALKTKQK